MPSPHELDEIYDKQARTEVQRLEDKRFDSAFAFETMPDKEYERRLSIKPKGSQFGA